MNRRPAVIAYDISHPLRRRRVQRRLYPANPVASALSFGRWATPWLAYQLFSPSVARAATQSGPDCSSNPTDARVPRSALSDSVRFMAKYRETLLGALARLPRSDAPIQIFPGNT